ncbi:MAG: flagellar hook-length control protein FliK [Nitrospirae bacterium]|nr:MAG: flagellar hook-length control protein FliK [Nitrospirota bacterium]
MLTPAVNVEAAVKKSDMKSFGVDLQSTAGPDNDFAKNLKVLLSGNEVNKDSLVVDANGNQVKVMDLMQNISKDKNIFGEDVISILEQLMAQFQSGSGIQSGFVVRQGPVQSGQGAVQQGEGMAGLMFPMLSMVNAFKQPPANTELKSLMQAYSASDGAIELAEAFKGVMKADTATPVMDNSGKMDIADFKLLLGDASKELQAVNVDVKFTVLGDKEFSLIDAMSKDTSAESLLKEAGLTVLKDEGPLKTDANGNSNMSALAAAGTAYNDNKNVTVKDAVNVTKIKDIDVPIMKTIEGGGKHLLVRLDPPDLGSVQIKLSMDNGVLRADFKVESSAIKDLFTANMPHIKTSLENSGLKVGEFFVDVSEEGFYYSDDRSQGGNKDDSKQQQQNQQRQAKDEKLSFSDLFA